MKEVYLSDVAFARSGDKGDVCNIGIMAKSKNIYEYLEKILTPEKIKDHFKGMVKGGVEIYRLPNIDSLEVVLRRSLGGGATCTLRFDQTGKSMCGALLRLKVEVDEALLREAVHIDALILDKYRH